MTIAPNADAIRADFTKRREAIIATREAAAAKLADLEISRRQLALAAAESGNGAAAKLATVEAEADDTRRAVERSLMALETLEAQEAEAVNAARATYVNDGLRRLRELQKSMDRAIHDVLGSADDLALAVGHFAAAALDAQALSLELQKAGVDRDAAHFNGRCSVVDVHVALVQQIFSRLAPLAPGGIPAVLPPELKRSRAFLGL